MEEITGTLEEWSVRNVGKKKKILHGFIYNDSMKRFNDGTLIRTSLVKSGKMKEGHKARTMNSTYLLGKKYDGKRAD